MACGYRRRRGGTAPGTGPDRRGSGRHRVDPGPGTEPPRAGHVRRDVVRALLLQVLPHPPEAAADRGGGRAGGPGRERRRPRCRRRHRRGHSHRVAQPPVGHRALPGGGHRGRGDPARHLHHGRSPDRPHGPAALRAPGRPPFPMDRRGRRGRHLGLRELRRRPHRRWGGGVRRDLQGQSAGQRPLPRGHADGPSRPRPGLGGGEPGRAPRLVHGPGRDRRGQRPRFVGLQRGDRRRQAAIGPGRRSLRGEAPHRGLPHPARRGPGGRHPGLRRGRPDLCHQRDRLPGGHGHGRRRERRPPSGAGHGALRGDDQRVPGADAGHRRARGPRRGHGHLRPVGGGGGRRGQGDDGRPVADPGRVGRGGPGRRPGVLPPRRRPAL